MFTLSSSSLTERKHNETNSNKHSIINLFQDENVRSVVVRGEGKVFSSGHNLKVN